MNKLRRIATRLAFALIHPRTCLPRPADASVRQVEFLGVPMVVLENEDIGRAIATTGRFENREIGVIRRRIGRNDVCLDVGANIGVYTLLFARAAPAGEVISFEPVRLPRSILNLNLALNNLTNVTVLPVAANDTVGTIRFMQTCDSAYSSMKATGRKSLQSEMEIQATTIDTVLNGRPANVLKIDVEGAEVAVLNGALDTLSSASTRPHTIMVEVNETNLAVYGRTAAEIHHRLATLGYTAHSLMADGTVMKGWRRPGSLEDAFFFVD